jgi:S-adenosylmethionine:diacylglycerol 3-amino-3-carboxypropyl transferase
MKLKQNHLQFAITREDPQVEEFLIRKLSTPQVKILLIGSGGCTAFHLQSQFPDIQITLVEPNP